MDQGPVAGVRLGFGDQTTPPVIPFPHELRIFGEGLRCGQILGLELFPQSAGAAERWDAALSRDAGAGERDYRGSGVKQMPDFGCWMLDFGCWVIHVRDTDFPNI